jgi:hypothetical protein
LKGWHSISWQCPQWIGLSTNSGGPYRAGALPVGARRTLIPARKPQGAKSIRCPANPCLGARLFKPKQKSDHFYEMSKSNKIDIK